MFMYLVTLIAEAFMECCKIIDDMPSLMMLALYKGLTNSQYGLKPLLQDMHAMDVVVTQ